MIKFNMAAQIAIQDINDSSSKNTSDKVIELGFVEKLEDPAVVTSPFFPSKVGGKPAWLALTGLPYQILCKNCTRPLIFLLQVYVPSENLKSLSYHRTVFVFCCRNGNCYTSINCNKPFIVLRCQLTRENKFYPPDLSFQEQDEIIERFKDLKLQVGSDWTKLCAVCGCRGDKLCAKCHAVHYCGKDHQVVHWKMGHKNLCGTGGQISNQSDLNASNLLFPEYELVTEPEVIKKISENSQDDGDHDSLKKYKEYLEMNGNDGTSYNDWSSFEAESRKINDIVKDKAYLAFKKRISLEPEQVVRYQRHGNPLWISNLNTPRKCDIPKCPCGAERTFEFQVLPQLLNHMKVDSLEASIDWGTLAVYTCSKDCVNDNEAYHQEFIWKQDFSNTELPADILHKLQK